MKQIRFKHLATLGVCCSLFSNSLAGVTAVAETMTIESSPTAASHEQTASTKESAETEVKETQATETSEAPTKESQEEQENGAAEEEEQGKEEAVANGKKEVEETQESETAPVLPQPMPLSGVGTKAGNMDTYYQQIETVRANILNNKSAISQAFPGARIGFEIKSLDGMNLDIADFDLDVTMKLGRQTNGTWTWGADSAVPTEKAINNLDVLTPSKTLSVAVRPSTITSDVIMYFMREPQLTVPKYVESVEFVDNPQLNTIEATWNGLTKPREMNFLKISKVNDTLYKLSAPWPSAYGGITPQLFNYTTIGITYTSMSNYATNFGAMFPNKDFTLGITNRKVTESFKSPTGATIPPPPNFEEGRKTSITNNDFTYTQSGTLPKSYKGADGRTYFLKGWYKGKTKPETLSTGTPSYKVTYDDNDDLTVVYEEPVTRVVTVPAVTYQFGFVTEKGTYVYDAKVTGNATEVANDEKTTVAPLISKANGIYQEIAVPTRRLSYHDQLSSFYGVTDFNLKIPKYYKTPTVKPGSYFTGPAGGYPTAVISNRNLITNAVINSESTGVNYSVVPNSRLGAGNYSMSTTTFPNDTTKTAFARPLSEAQATNSMIRYNTTDAPMLYFLENRRINARYVDQDGNKLTSLPPDVKQDTKTPITSENFTFMHGTTLPDSYKGTDGKTYKFKGWYRGKSKPNTLQTTKQPSYQATFDDNDDLTVVYDSREMVDFPALTYQFGFVDEAGKRVDATKVGLTYDNWVGKSLTGTTDWTTVSLEKGQVAPTKNNLKEIAYPSQSIERKSGETSQFSAANLTFTLPRYYEKMSVYNKTGAFDTAYPFPNVQYSNSTTPIVENSNKNVSKWFELKKSGTQSFVFNTTVPAAAADAKVPGYLRQLVHDATSATKTTYYTIGQPVYYYLTNRKVTENFIDPAGNKLTDAPTGFKQGQQTAITTDPYTYTSAKALPASYKGSDGKTYIFKGWYRGKTKPNTLETTKTPSYQATFDGNDDLNVVYEESDEKTVTIPAVTYKFGFVNEKGTLVAPTNFVMQTNLTTVMNGVATKTGTATTTNSGSYKQLTMPSQQLTYTPTTKLAYSGATDFQLAIPRYYKMPTVKPGTYYTGSSTAYPMATTRLRYTNNAIADERLDVTGQQYSLYATNTAHSYRMFRNFWESDTTKTLFNGVLSRANTDGNTPTYYTTDDTMYYFLENRRVTENFIDSAGNKLPSVPTGFKQGQQTVINSSPFTYTSAKALPASYKGSDGKTYIFKGWYRGKTKPNTLETTKTPSYQATFDGNDDLNVVYEEGVASVEASLKGVATIMPSGGSQLWNMIIKNTGTAPLTGLKVTPTANWSSGLATPIQLSVKVGTGGFKNIPVTKETWKQGIALDTEIPVGQSAMIQISTVGTGAPLEVLQAELNVTSNAPTATVSSTVRIQGTDQEVTDPVGEGFISLPTFDFGQVGIAGTTTQHGLKKAADYYGNGTRNPFVRIKKSQPNWSLTAQLSQPKSAKDSLPTATRLLLGQAAVSKVDNYNLVTEMLNPVGMTSALSLTANNAVTNVITDKQFTGNDVYHLDFNFNNVKLEVPANQGTKGEQYNATVTWNLVTGP
ncbi:WxL domain-containing protein [Enterococcus faecalis]|uniref:WxL domain-containing protein n=1 Tax=Enterococcus faecalis TaxID=1351 RepID=UPI0034CE250D